MSDTARAVDASLPGPDEVIAVSRGIATAVAPASGITDVQAPLLRALTKALTEIDVDYRSLEPLGPEELAVVLAPHDELYRARIVQHMVLGELVLHPVPPEVAHRVGEYSAALGVDDDFVGIARRYAAGALGLAWVELRRDGFVDRWDESRLAPLHAKAANANPFDETAPDAELADRWHAFADLDEGTLGRSVYEMYRERDFWVPGGLGAASPMLAQHDFVHVLADYGTTMEGELEVFAFLGRADPDPKGFAWLATMIGLFETGHVHATGFFSANVGERHLETPGMDVRLADAIRRGKRTSEQFRHDLFDVDYHQYAAMPLDEVRGELAIPGKSPDARAAGSPGPFDEGGMSEAQRAAGLTAAQRDTGT